MAKPAAVLSSNTFETWRTRFNTLLAFAPEVIESTSAPAATDDDYEVGAIWVNKSSNTAYVLVHSTLGEGGANSNDAIWVQLGATPGALKDDGTVPLTANWDVGNFQIRMRTGYFDVASGTAPFTVLSNTLVSNLNADLLDGNHASALLARTNHTGTQAMSTISDAGNVATLDTISNAYLNNMAAWTLKLRNNSASGDPQDVKISALTEEASPASGDWILGETAEGALRKYNVSNIQPAADSVTNTLLANMAAYTLKLRNAGTTGNPADVKISALTEEAAPASTDWLLGEEAGGALRKFSVGKIKPQNDTVTNAMLSNMAANTIKLRNAGTTGDPGDVKVSGLTAATSVDGAVVLGEVGGSLRKFKADMMLINDTTVKTASFTATPGKRYFVETDTGSGSASDVIVTLPTPTAGDIIEIFHVGNGDVNAANEGLELEPGGSYRIMGGALGENLVFDVSESAVRVVYLNSTYGWRVAVL